MDLAGVEVYLHVLKISLAVVNSSEIGSQLHERCPRDFWFTRGWFVSQVSKSQGQ